MKPPETEQPVPLVCVVVTRDHHKYVGDCLRSIHAELPGVPVWLVDMGSRDTTVEFAQHRAAKLGLVMNSVLLPRGLVSLRGIAEVAQRVSAEWGVLISGDDALGPGYGDALAAAISNSPNVGAVCFDLVLTDAKLVPQGLARARWKGRQDSDRRALSLRNPGTAPGCAVSWPIVKDAITRHYPRRMLMEDLWMWWTILAKAPIVRSPEGFVVYRRHGANSSGRRNASFSYSIGYGAGMAMAQAHSFDRKLRSLIQLLRALSVTPLRQVRFLRAGYRRALNDRPFLL